MEFPHVQYETCLHPCWTGGCSQMFQLAVLVYHYPIIGQARAALVIFFVSPGDWSLRSLLLVKPVQHSGHFEVLVISILLFYRHPAIAQRQKRGGESRRHASLPSWQFWSSFFGRSVGDKKPILGILSAPVGVEQTVPLELFDVKVQWKDISRGDRYFIAFYSIYSLSNDSRNICIWI